MFQYTGDETCQEDPTQKYSFDLKIYCKDGDNPPAWKTNPDDPCRITIEWNSPEGCPIIKANAIWNFFHKYKEYLTPAVIIAGLFFLILGGYFVKISIFLIIFWTTLVAVLFVMYGIMLPFSTPDWVGWIVLIGAGVAGLILGTLLASFFKIGVFCVGCWLGGLLATCVFEMVVYKISNKPIVLWGMIAAFALVVAIISLKFLKIVLIVGTSFVGSYLIVRGVSFYLGGYPNEFELFNDIQVGDIDNVPFTMYIYFGAMVVL